ncbi:hypothetical protein HK104_009234 [Borealophlyctis nickersoniae]|nr:hypothetical protein HK104_009234 [Borealophlyctis nickersoniae]
MTLRILCFGDSLTEGYSNYGTLHHPYSIQLEKRFKKDGRFKIEIVTSGVSGDMVLSRGGDSMFNRLKDALSLASESEEPFDWGRRLKDALSLTSESNKPFDWVVIMAGINDLGRGAPVPTIYGGLQRLCTLVKDHGAKCLVLTCLPVDKRVFEWRKTSVDSKDPREMYNDLIREGALTPPNHYHVYDIEKDFSYQEDLKERAKWWCDECHCTAAGYDRIGDLVFGHLSGLICGSSEEQGRSG